MHLKWRNSKTAGGIQHRQMQSQGGNYLEKQVSYHM